MNRYRLILAILLGSAHCIVCIGCSSESDLTTGIWSRKDLPIRTIYSETYIEVFEDQYEFSGDGTFRHKRRGSVLSADEGEDFKDFAWDETGFWEQDGRQLTIEWPGGARFAAEMFLSGKSFETEFGERYDWHAR